ncbi:MAG: twitching motility protein PilT [Thaumarchaeota archaeon]|nr:twitching motility protein PilT [Nitrososphaerota archaeon]
MVKVITDTSFLMLLVSNRIKNMNDLDVEIGQIEFVVPEIVVKELKHLSNDESKGKVALQTLELIKSFETNSISGKTADDGILNFVKENGGIVATIDKELKTKIKDVGGSILSIHNDKIVLEN